MRSGQPNRGSYKHRMDVASKRVAALLFVSILILATLTPLLSFNSDSESGGSQTHTVVYHPGSAGTVNGDYNSDSASDIEVTYYGSIVSTEYNPQMWFHGSVSDGGSSTLPENTGRWYEIKKYEEGKTLVFTGWQYATSASGDSFQWSSTSYYPGEVLSSSQIEAATSNTDGKIHIRATWATLENYQEIDGSSTSYGNFSTGGVYTNIVLLKDATKTVSKIGGNGFTLRGSGSSSTVDLTYELRCAVIMDNVKIKASSLRTHANMMDFGNTFSANSHVFIVGSGVTTIASGSNSDIRYIYPTVFGGILSSTVTPDYTERVPYTTSGKTESEKMASFMIMHAGTFSNVVSGGYRTGYTGSGYLVMKDTMVLDSLVGGTGGLTSWSSSSGEIRGSSYMYLTAVTMPGDSYGESKIGRNLGFGLLESTIITGGSGYGKVTESTNVFVSGTSDVWDVQGSGRCGYSYVNTANLEISGNSIVRHAACGSITDGKKNTTQNVEYISIVAKDASKVGNIYGGGYDTWDSPDNPSMFKNGTISVSVEDHAVVGGVYGGGYRGDIGSASERIDGISISISGGTILGNVYGGGCGGVDKVLHNSDGSISSQSNSKNSTGKSRVYANSIEISISGTAEIRGDVYGGGQSAPVISSSGFYSPVDDVASVECDTVSITISGAEVSMYGDVYGGGMGVDTKTTKTPTIDVMMNTGEMFSYDWYSGSSSLTYKTTGYSEFAGVTATSVSISMTGLKGTDSPDGIGVGNVYGGGALGVLSNGTTSIVLDDAFIKGCVYGGGKGSDSDSGAGHVENADGITIELKGESVLGSLGDVTGVIGGGDKATTESSKIAILMGKDVVIYGDVYGGGIGASGKASTHSNRTILLNGASINGNIYGGSSLGNDCKLSETPEFADRTCTILLVSGVVTQGVYGGGYNGKSYLNSTILVGTDAATYAMDLHLITEYNIVEGKSYRLLINDIYGGGNLDPTTIESDLSNTLGSLFDSPLLMGSAEIRISAKEAGSFPGYDAIADSDTLKNLVNKICINGDIFGSGNYSSVKGNTSLYIAGYLQYEKTSIKSIQRFDEVSMSDTHITLSGSSDGSVTDITTLVSLCSITDLSLNGGVTLELSAETSKISSYYSRVGTVYATESDCGPDGKGNTVKLIDGVYFAILGPNNTGMVDEAKANGTDDIPDSDKIGRIYGFTYLTRQTGEGYYGAFAMSSDLTQDDSGFAVEDGNDIRKADVIAGDPKTSPIKTWYIAGYQELTERVTFSGSKTESSITLRLPRTVTGSYYAYIGNYTDPEIQDGFYLLKDVESVDKIKDETEKGKVFISASFANGVSVVSHTVDKDGNLDSIVDSDSKRGSDNRPKFTTNLLRNTSGQAGYIGTVTIHIAEYGSETSEIPINRINMVIQINIDPKIDGNSANMCISVPGTVSSGKNRGSGYIQLKSDKGTIVRYTLVSAEIENGDTISIWSDVLRNGSNGWTQRIYNEDNPLNVTNDTKGVYLGEGLGNKDSTLGFTYDGSETSFKLTISDDSGITYNITVNLVESADVKLNFAYRPIGENSAMQYLSVAGSGTEADPFILTWTTTGSAFQLPYGTVLGSQKFHFEFNNASAEMTIEAALQKMMDITVSLGDTNGTSFNYGENLYGWFINESCLTKYNMLSTMKEDLTLYAGYGIKITFNGNGAHASPTEFYIRPGETLSKYFLNVGEEKGSDDDRVQVLREAALDGYEMNPIAWVYGSNAEKFDFGTKVYAPIDLYINWVPKEYTLAFEFYTSSNATSKIDHLDVIYSPDASADKLNAAYRTTVKLTLNDDSYRFASSLTSGIEFRGFGTKNLEFEMPAVDKLTNENSLTVKIIVQKGYTLTVQPSGLGHTLEKFNRYGVQLTHDDGRSEQEMLDLTDGVGTTFVSSSHGHSLTIVPNENFGKDWCWAFWYLDNGEWIYYSATGRGQVSLELSGASGDLVVGYSLYKVVKLNLGNTVDHVKRTWNGDQTEDSLENGSSVCEGDILEPVPKTGYSCPPKVTVGVICKDGKYTVTGNEDVTFAEMTPNSVTVVVNFTLDSKYVHKGFNVTLILGLLRNEAEQKVSISITATSSEKSDTKQVAAEGEVLGVDEITARIAGFELTTKTYDGTKSTLTLGFKLIEYTVHYKPIRGDVWDYDTDTMNVIDGGFQLRSDGTASATVAGNIHPVWLSLGNINDGQIVGFVWVLSPESFGNGMYNDNYSHLYLVGLEPFTGSSEKEMTIVAEQSALKNGVDVTEEFRKDNPDALTVTTPEGITVGYSDGKLTVEGPGTGQFTVTIGGYKVTIVSIGTVQSSG